MLWTSSDAAIHLGLHRSTTAAAAKFGRVDGARQETRPGTINPPWVADEVSWRKWYRQRPTAGRPKTKPESLIGKIIDITDRQSMYYKDWGVITNYDGRYHVAIAWSSLESALKNCREFPVFNRSEFKIRRNRQFPPA